MHTVANEVPVPTDQIERELLALANKRFTGRAKLTLRVKPEAALSVEVLKPETTETTRIGDRTPERAPELFRNAEPNERELIVKRMLVSNAYRFRLHMDLIAVICDFKEGALLSAQWIQVGL